MSKNQKERDLEIMVVVEQGESSPWTNTAAQSALNGACHVGVANHRTIMTFSGEQHPFNTSSLDAVTVSLGRA